MGGSEGALLRLRLGEWILLVVVVRAAPLAAVAAADGPPVRPAAVAPAARVFAEASLRLRRGAVRVVSSKRPTSLRYAALVRAAAPLALVLVPAPARGVVPARVQVRVRLGVRRVRRRAQRGVLASVRRRRARRTVAETAAARVRAPARPTRTRREQRALLRVRIGRLRRVGPARPGLRRVRRGGGERRGAGVFLWVFCLFFLSEKYARGVRVQKRRSEDRSVTNVGANVGAFARASRSRACLDRARSSNASRRASRAFVEWAKKRFYRKNDKSVRRHEKKLLSRRHTFGLRFAFRSPPRTFFMLGRFTGFGTESLLAVAIVRPFVCGVETVG